MIQAYIYYKSTSMTQLSGVQNGQAQEYKKTIPDKVTLVGNFLVQNKAILAKKAKFYESPCQI